MKNFFRLAQFAWPYRLRFWASIGCAIMVALLWFTNIGAVLPLLKILFYSQNAKSWVTGELDSISGEIAALEAQRDQVDLVSRLVGPGRKMSPQLKTHIQEINVDVEAKTKILAELEGKIDVLSVDGVDDEQLLRDKARLNLQTRLHAVASASRAELRRDMDLVHQDDWSGLAQRRLTLTRALDKQRGWLGRYQWLQPRVERYLPSDNFHTLVLLLALVLSAVALKGVFLFLQEVLVADIMQLSLFDIRNLFYRRTMALDLSHFGDQGSAELMSRFTNDMDSLSQGLNTLLSKVVREPLRVIACLCGAMWLNWRLTCLTLVLVPVSAATTYRAGKIMKRAVRRSLESMSNIYKILQESFQGIKVVKAFTMERYERRRFFLETKSLYRKSVRVATIDALSDPVLEMLSLMTVMIALMAGSFLVLRRQTFLDLGFFRLQLAARPMMIEDLFTLYAMLAGVSDPIRKLANVHSRIQRAAAASDRICALMDRQPKVADAPGVPRLQRHRKGIEFDRVEFSYNGREPVLRGLTLDVRHGETIALVGPNGCGKSTLMNLLPRFWDVHSGAIRIDGHDLRQVQLRSLRSQLGMVTQETILFEDTIANNISYGNLHASRDAIEAAARRSYAHQFITKLDEGYDTIIGERGMSLSGGQRQRIALARAMLRDPAILVLDEATSAVDIQDEALIRKAIEEFARNRTTFLITHSLGSLQFADRIVLMNAGRIEAVGTDAELRRSSPLYRRLHEIHFQRESA